MAQVIDSAAVVNAARLYSRAVSYASGPRDGRELWDGARLKEIREYRGLSQEQLAERATVGAAEISRHEQNGPKSNPTIAVLGRLARALDVALYVVMAPAGAPIPRPDQEHQGDGRQQDGQSNSLWTERLAALDGKFPAENSWRGDIQQAQSALADAAAALARALRRPDEKSGAA